MKVGRISTAVIGLAIGVLIIAGGYASRELVDTIWWAFNRWLGDAPPRHYAVFFLPVVLLMGYWFIFRVLLRPDAEKQKPPRS